MTGVSRHLVWVLCGPQVQQPTKTLQLLLPAETSVCLRFSSVLLRMVAGHFIRRNIQGPEQLSVLS